MTLLIPIMTYAGLAESTAILTARATDAALLALSFVGFL